jgi:S-adenosylmethionine:tRNA ribosyltransferase-isomerase
MSLNSLSSYHYDLPAELIAQHPLKERDQSRLLCLDRSTGDIVHRQFHDLPTLLRSGDVLVRNRTRVFPARLFGHKPTGAKVELLLVHPLPDGRWKCLLQPSGRVKPGTRVELPENGFAEVGEFLGDGSRPVGLDLPEDFHAWIQRVGIIPLPPYIRRDTEPGDRDTYQTVYAREEGSVAAPTAGFHFTPELFATLSDMGVQTEEVVLHVGPGTFLPVKTDNIADHHMHPEFCVLEENTAERLNAARREGRRIIAVGTTTVRTLESFLDGDIWTPGERWTSIFLHPGNPVRSIDGLITNFHLPESTLIMLVSAFAGYEFTMNAYRTAVAERYRFYSYGDAMVIL